MSDRVQFRRDTKARWEEVNPVLMEGEIGLEIDTNNIKMGDGVHAWNELEYGVGIENITSELGNSKNLSASQKLVTHTKEIADIYGIELVPSEDNIGWYSGGDYRILEPEGKTYGHYIYNVEGINSDIYIRTRSKNQYTVLYGLFDKDNNVLSYGNTTDKQQKCYLDLSKYPTASKLLVNFIISEKEGTIVYRAYRENEVIDPYVHPDYNIGWIPKERTIYTILLDNNFWHSIYKIDKSKDITFSGITTNNPYYYYFLYLDSYGRIITQGSLINTGNDGVTTINKEDIPESAVFAVIHYKSSEKPIYSNGNTYTVSAEYIYHRTNYVYENDIIYNVRTDAFVNYGWVLNNVWHSTDKNFVIIALRLDKTSNLFVKNAASDNAYFNYIDFRDSSFKNVGGLKQTSNTEDTLTPEDYPENAVYAIIHITIHIFSNKLYEINNGVKTAFLTTEEFANRMEAINYVHPDYNIGWIPKERTIYTILLDNNFWHSIYKIDKSKDITFSGITTNNPYYYYFLYLDSYGRIITQGSLINTGNDGVTTINKEDIPESAVFAVIHYKSSEKPIYSNGNTYTVSAEYIYHRTNYVYENDIIYNVRTDAFVNYGWVLNNVWHSTDKNFVIIALRLDKTSNLFVKNAASDNAYFNYIDFRDSSFKNVGGLKQTSNTEDTLTPEDYPENAVYAIIHITIHIFSNKLYEINNGVKTAFLTTEEFANRMEAINKEIADDILLPPTIYAVVDDTLQIFYEDIFYGNNINDWSFKVRCSKGKNFPRYFEYTPTTNDVGETNLEISLVRKSSKKDIYPENSVIATAKLVTVLKAQSPSKERHILCIGDSTLAASSGLWGRECARRLVSTGGTPNADALKNIKFTGRLHTDIDNTNVFGYEGNSGWQWSTYISSSQKAIRFHVNGVSSVSLGAKYRSQDGQVYDIAEVNITDGVGNIRCTYPTQASFPTPPSSGKLIRVYGDGDNEITYTSINEESYSPFITNGVFDFTNYINTHCGGSIDVLAISLGINFIVNIVNNNMSDIDSSLGSSVRTFLDKFHEQYPNAKVIIGTLQKASLLGGFGYNFGANEIADGDYYHRKLYALNKEYIKIASEDKYATFVYLANVNAEFDARHCYPQIDKKVNVRNSSTEKIDTNFGHLTESGYMMMSDSFYRCITYLLNKVF